MFRRLLLLSLLVTVLFPASVFSQSEKKKALYFYSQDCPHCERVEDYFKQEKLYDRYEIRKIDVSGHYNMEYLIQFFEAFGVKKEKRGWPAIFFGQEVLVGDQPIIENFAGEMEAKGLFEFPQAKTSVKTLSMDSSSQEISPVIVLLAAMVDAINPCAIAVILMLVGSVISTSGKRKGFFAGITFSLSIFIAYSIFGFIAYFALGAWRIPVALSILVGIIAFVVGVAHLKDFIWYGRMFTTEVPFSWRPKVQNILRSVKGTLGAFGAGFLMSVFLLPCVGGPYIVVIGLLAERESLIWSVWYIMLYNFIFILPLLGITLAIYFGTQTGVLEELRKKHARLLHGAVGGIMIFIGGYILVSSIY